MDTKLYWSKILLAACAMGVLACLPQYINWSFNETVLNVMVSSLFQIFIVAVLLYVFGNQVALASDTGDGYQYGKAYSFVILSSLCAGVITTFLSWLLINVIDPNMGAEIIRKATEQSMNQGFSDDMLNASLSVVKFFMSFSGLLITNVLSMGVTGGLVGLITSALVKRNPQL